MSEEWRWVPGWEYSYEVSDLGRVRSWRAPRVADRPLILRLGKTGRSGYLVVQARQSPVREYFLVHRAVLAAFVGPCPEGYEVAHEDGDRTNNRLDNLRYKTPTENAKDKVRHGTQIRGERVAQSKLNEHQVKQIRRAHLGGYSTAALAGLYGVSQRTVQLIASGKQWKHVA